MTTNTKVALMGATWAALILAGIITSCAQAQTVPGKADLSWDAVTTGCTLGITPCNNVPLTAAEVVTGYEIYASTSPIPDTSTAAPIATVTGSVVTFAYTTTVTNGQTLYFRLKAVNVVGKGGFSNQATKLISLQVLPNVPTSVTITLTIG